VFGFQTFCVQFITAVDVSGFNSRSVPPRDAAEFEHDESDIASGQDAGTSSAEPESENDLSLSSSDEENSDDSLEPDPSRVPVEDNENLGSGPRIAEDPDTDTAPGADDDSFDPVDEEPGSPTTWGSDIDAASRADDDSLDPDYIPYPLRVPADLDDDVVSDVAPETNEKESGSSHDPGDIPRPQTTAKRRKRRKRPLHPSCSPEGDADQSEVESGLVSNSNHGSRRMFSYSPSWLR
jgi:hypothetical protein